MGNLRKAKVMYKNSFAGILEETERGYRFTYDPEFLNQNQPIAVALPVQKVPFESEGLFPFFQGLLPEGWYRQIVSKTLKIDPKDDFGFLMGTCRDCIGAVWIDPSTEHDQERVGARSREAL